MSIAILEKAIYFHAECMENDFFDYSGNETENIMFLYDMIANQGEAETLNYLIENDFI